jgi:hypothetical protein
LYVLTTDYWRAGGLSQVEQLLRAVQGVTLVQKREILVTVKGMTQVRSLVSSLGRTKLLTRAAYFLHRLVVSLAV